MRRVYFFLVGINNFMNYFLNLLFILKSFEDLKTKFNTLIDEIDISITEENFRIMKMIPTEKLSEMDLVDKYSFIGKIGSEKTHFMEENQNKGFKIENLKPSLLNLKANNCIFKGKWIYEVLLLTNMDIVLGWVSIIKCFKIKLLLVLKHLKII